mmetsp:Transcript_23288/g.46747  ORF Transcript_23288/g.46747 Transcript_23288/m.46747 type:complete len:135 (+) Transcript_23288:217-621(+)|eukprot:CAMPEP_0196760574 /NCGR_PEP_ID=MMETSP1091-20130531/105292_1 /TAXON_ID=302021 /ORGANISM="Rhodomonas sp., Strain CCMP768" /LENGTH=134 /DNA_ID=CAMNT_0042109469 /DNA_START=217 /DNA_END=621 /DNA_ORIENTATION=-
MGCGASAAPIEDDAFRESSLASSKSFKHSVAKAEPVKRSTSKRRAEHSHEADEDTERESRGRGRAAYKTVHAVSKLKQGRERRQKERHAIMSFKSERCYRCNKPWDRPFRDPNRCTCSDEGLPPARPPRPPHLE